MSRRKELTDYTVGGFAADQFTGARLEFLAWYDVAQNPHTAAAHPLVVSRFGAALDPEHAQEVLEWWREGLDELLSALDETQMLLGDGVLLSDPRVEKLLLIARHVENVSGHLLESLGRSKLQDA